MKRRTFLSLAGALPLTPNVNFAARGGPPEHETTPLALGMVEKTFEKFKPTIADATPACRTLQSLADRVAVGRWGLPPILLLGDPGMGTDLLRAFSRRVHWLAPDKYIKLTFANHYMNTLIRYMQRGEVPKFRRIHSKACDGLLFDDIAPIASYEALQGEFLANLEVLAASDKPVIMTSSLHPDDIQGLSWELRQYLKGCTQLTVRQ